MMTKGKKTCSFARNERFAVLKNISTGKKAKSMHDNAKKFAAAPQTSNLSRAERLAHMSQREQELETAVREMEEMQRVRLYGLCGASRFRENAPEGIDPFEYVMKNAISRTALEWDTTDAPTHETAFAAIKKTLITQQKPTQNSRSNKGGSGRQWSF